MASSRTQKCFACLAIISMHGTVSSFGIKGSPRKSAFLYPIVDKTETPSGRQRSIPRTPQINPARKVSPLQSTKKESDEVEPLSDIDARVLQSLLEDQNLDLKSEENLKKMLENGVKKKDTTPPKSKVEEKESEFSSTFLKTITDSELWNGFVAKAEEIVESAQIFVQNRIERDAQLLASLGLFAWQRALKDVGRALPSAGKSGAEMAKKMRNSLFLLTNNSSFVGYIPDDNFILPPSKYSAGVEQPSVYDELNTPMDEIKVVTQAIKDILSGKSVSQDNKGLRSVAPAGSAKNNERQRMAYERKKETVLKREKEGVDKKVLRATSSITDTAWELKKEMELEGNEAGYRAKKVQRQIEGTLESAGLLGSGMDKPFRGIGERLFGTSKSGDSLQIEGSANVLDEEIEVMPELTKADLDQERKRVIERLRACLEKPGDTWLKPGTAIEVVERQSQSTASDQVSDVSGEDTKTPFYMDTPNVNSTSDSNLNEPTPAPVNPMSDESWENLITTMVFIRNDIEVQCEDETEVYANEDAIFAELQSLKNSVLMISSLAAASAGYEASQALKLELLGSLEEDVEQGSLLSSLDGIISLKENQRIALEERRQKIERQRIAEEERRQEMERQRIEEEARRQVMERQRIAEEAERQEMIKEESMKRDAEAQKDPEYIPTIDANVSLPKDDSTTIVDDVIMAEVVISDEEISKEDSYEFSSSADDVYETVVVSEVLSGDVTSNAVSMDKQILSDVEFEVVASPNSIPNNDYGDKEANVDDGIYAEVEIVTDADLDQFKEVDDNLNSAAFDESDVPEAKETPVAVKIALRALDISLFVAEKTITVGIPGIFTSYKLVRERTEEVQRDGMGKEGWSVLENVSDASKRY